MSPRYGEEKSLGPCRADCILLRMTTPAIALRLGGAVLALGLFTQSEVAAQSATVADRLVSSWILTAVDKQAGSSTPVRARAPHGLLVLDGAGNVFEFFSAT